MLRRGNVFLVLVNRPAALESDGCTLDSTDPIPRCRIRRERAWTGTRIDVSGETGIGSAR
jgi:hypothetical protein